MGDRIARKIVQGFGTWSFLFSFMFGCGFWMFANSTGLMHIDLFPYTLLNLMLSLMAAGQGSLIMIANRQILKMQAEADIKRDKTLRAILKMQKSIDNHIKNNDQKLDELQEALTELSKTA